MGILVANAGSSSLKLRMVEDGGEAAGRPGPGPDGREAAGRPGPAGGEGAAGRLDLGAPSEGLDAAAIERFVASGPPPEAVGHRIVHGGSEFRTATVVDGETLHRLEALGDFAPLHNGPALAVLELLRRLCPDVPHVACFDTAFHATLPDAAALYALPREWVERHGLRRFGFHGLSHAWAARRAAELLGRAGDPELALVTCHLGSGASLAAVRGGRSVDTTMGFTPNEGLVMATRSGSVDPGLLVWLLRDAGVTAAELDVALERESGLRGLAGTGDMRALLAAEADDPRAATAIEVYLHRLRAAVAAMAAATEGVDALVFTGGVGENAPAVRARACAPLAFLGLALDSERNDAPSAPDADLSAPDAPTRALVVASREELEIARLTRAALDRSASS